MTTPLFSKISCPNSVRELVELAFGHIGRRIAWEGAGVAETGVDAASGATPVAVDPLYYRPTEVKELCGDASKARRELGWEPRITFAEMVREMVEADRRLLRIRTGRSSD